MNKFKIMLMIIILIFIGLVAYYKYLDNKNRVLMTSIPEIPINNVKKNEIEVFFNTNYTYTNNGKVKFTIDTNLPDGMAVILTLKNANGFNAQDKVTILNGKIISDEFSKKGNAIDDGSYQLCISSSAVQFYSDAIKKQIGENGELLKGKYVKYTSLFDCYLIDAVIDITIKNNSKISSSSPITSSNTKTNSYNTNQHNCTVKGCTKKGIYNINNIPGKEEYYCSQHYEEMLGFVSTILGY